MALATSDSSSTSSSATLNGPSNKKPIRLRNYQNLTESFDTLHLKAQQVKELKNFSFSQTTLILKKKIIYDLIFHNFLTLFEFFNCGCGSRLMSNF